VTATSTENALPLGPRPAVRRIQPAKGLFRVDARELWRFHELLLFLMWRDVKARYRQTILGSFWAIFRPFVSMVIFTVIFGHLAGISPGSDLPYALFVFPGVLLWTYFGSGVSGGAASVTGNGSLVTRAYFPRVHLVLAAIIAPVLDFFLGLLVVFGMFAWYERWPSWHIVTLPLFLGLTVFVVFGISLWLSALTVRYRDVPFALPFLLQIWMYLTPVIYPTTFVPEKYNWLLALNPVTGAAVGTRWSLVGGTSPGPLVLLASVGIGLVLVLTGLVYFRRREPSFPDHI
jgi:lipopolysaccharide transport system permease protein